MKRPGLAPLALQPCVGGLSEIVFGFYFLWSGVVQGFVKALGAPRVHPPQGGKLDFSARCPRALSSGFGTR